MTNTVEIEAEHRETDQVFSYYHGGGMLHFNASLLARIRAALPPKCFQLITLDIGEDEYALCMAHRGIEEPKLAALTAAQLRDPGYAVLLDEQGMSFTIVDGHHRLVRRYRHGARQMKLWVTSRDIWQHCLVPYSKFDEAVLAQHMPERVAEPAQLLSRFTMEKP